MELQEKEDKLIEYLYGEMSSSEKSAFLKEIEANPELSGELKSYLQLRQVFHEQLPYLKAPKHLTHKVFQELGLKKPWYQSLTTGFWRPALAGAFVVLLAVGITSQLGRQDKTQGPQIPRVSQVTPKVSTPTFVSTRSNWNSNDSDFSDRLLVNRRIEPQLRVPVRPNFARVTYPGSGNMVSLAGYGGNNEFETTSNLVPETEIHRLDLEAERAVAQFLHQQALRMRAVGDFKGAAQELAHLIKTYPFYPFKLQAMAQRVDSLFRAGDFTTARSELKVLRELSPTLAYLIERRWGPEPTE